MVAIHRDNGLKIRHWPLLLLSLAASWATAQTQIEGVRLWNAPDHTRVVFDTTAAAEHKIIVLKDPHRIVVDFTDVSMKGPPPVPAATDKLLKGVRAAKREKTGMRVVLDLKKPVRPRSFPLQPNERYGHRLVVDLHSLEHSSKPVVHKPAANAPRQIVVAVDAGHGGEDPGAIGARGHREKDVVLAIARRLEKFIDAEPGMRAVMVRTGDYYVGLRDRMQKAREARADLFISIHADAFRDRRAHGASVFTVSRKGASSEAAKWLADRENAADLVGGISLQGKEDLLASVILDLSQTATIGASRSAADAVLTEIGRLTKLHKSEVQRAGFVVLKSPDIPSMLVETAFISNRAEERRLADPRHQQRLARALFKGTRQYFINNPVPGAVAIGGKREHRVRSGETLSGIAQHYAISLAQLRQANSKRGDRLRAGELLRIP